MRAIIFLLVLLIVCALCWFVAGILSPDAVGMAVGMLFGVLAGIPTALLMMAGNRQRTHNDDDYMPERQPAAPVVILYPPTPAQSNYGLPDRISPEDEHLYTYDLSAYGDEPRRVALPSNDEQRRLRRRVDAGMVKKLVDDDGAPHPGFRKLTRRDGKIEREEVW